MLVLTMDTDNAAFEDENEVPRVMERFMAQWLNGKRTGSLVDSNGNVVGSWSHKP